MIGLSPNDRIVILTGAGISKESGLETFRDPDGIWARHSIEDVATPEAFARDPDLVHRFYNDRRRQLFEPGIEPNAAHHSLARLERAWPGEVLLVTQNIDNLHERGGSRHLVHMHGEIGKVRCVSCATVTAWSQDLSVDTSCADCKAHGGLRPHVVWFGEMPMEMDRIFAALDECALFLSIGTSGTVYPAAGFVQEARLRAGAHCVELNLEATDGSSLFHDSRQGPASELVPAFVAEVLAGIGADAAE